MEWSQRRKERHFTEAARIAALAARRLRSETAVQKGTPELFVVRTPDSRFGWEIRRFGALVMEASVSTYDTTSEARLAGEGALSRRTVPV